MVIWTNNNSYHNCYHRTFKAKLVVYLYCRFRRWIYLPYEKVKWQLFSGVLLNTSSENFFKIQRENIWDIAFLLANLQAYSCFAVKFAMFFTTPFFKNTIGRLPPRVCNIATGGPSFYHNKTKIIHNWYFRNYPFMSVLNTKFS